MPFLLGKNNPAAFAAAAFAAVLACRPCCFSLRRRRLVAALFLVLAARRRGVGAFLAARPGSRRRVPGCRTTGAGPSFWQEAGARPATVIRMPVTFPPEAFADGTMLSGLGVPDLSGRIGKPAFYTSDPFFTPREGNDFSVEVVRLETNVGQAGHADRRTSRAGRSDARARSICP